MAFDIELLTTVHTIISLAAIVAGGPALREVLSARAARTWTNLFLVLAVATSVTGFFFPISAVTPAIVVGVIALIVLAATLAARFIFHSAGVWRVVYGAGLVISLYLLVFVGIAQAFGKIGVLAALAPTQSEPPFAIAQGIALLVFAWLGYLVVRRPRRVV